MKHQIALLAIAMTFSGATLCSCNNDDDELEPEIEQPQKEEPATKTIKGQTIATHVPASGRAYFEDYHAAGETAEVKAEFNKDEALVVTYTSTAWGTATFTIDQDLINEANGMYILPKDLQTDIVMTHGPMGGDGGGTYKLTLLSGSIKTDFTQGSLVMSAFMSESHGSYKLEFKQD